MSDYGEFGGQFIPETLMPAVKELEEEFHACRENKAFQEELQEHLHHFAGRPTPLYFARKLSERYGCKIYLKREDLLHTGAHKLNNALGQALLARHMGKERIIAETGAGQHGVATAVACAKLDLECDIYMGEVDIERQKPNVYRMELCGANVIPVSSGTRTLKDAINEALRDWTANVETSHYLLGSVLGPAPYPEIVAHFQSVIGRETREQLMDLEGRLPDVALACVGGGSNSIGLFKGFIDDEQVRLIGVEAGGKGPETEEHAARFSSSEQGRKGILHGTKTYVLQDEHGQISNTHSVSAGLDYSAIGPEHAHLRETGRATYTNVTDEEALNAFHLLSEDEGILPALESAHAIAYLPELTKEYSEEDIIVVNLSGRGDKDLDSVREASEDTDERTENPE